jgi:hypothetical protein
MSVQGPTAAPALAPYEDPTLDTTKFSPSTLLLFCTSRMETLDTSLQQYFAMQQKNNDKMQKASKLMEILGTVPVIDRGAIMEQDAEGKGQTRRNFAASMGTGIAEVYASTDDPQLRAQCAARFKEVTGREIGDFMNPDGRAMPVSAFQLDFDGMPEKVDGAQWQQKIEDVKNTVSGLSKNSELNMIKLQEIVSQRQLAIQITTQMMQALNEGAKQVAANLGR